MSAFELAEVGRTDLEREILAEHRWWRPEEIRQSAETIYPKDLVEMLAL